MELPVDPKAHLDVVLLGADMDIAGPLADRLRKDRVHQTDDGGLSRQVLKGRDLDFRRFFRLIRLLLGVEVDAIDQASQTGLGAVDAGDELRDFTLRADDGLHFRIRHDLDGIHDVDVERIRHRQRQQPAFFSQRRYLIFLRRFGRQHHGKTHFQGILLRVVLRDFQLTAQQVDDLGFADSALLDQILTQPKTRLLLPG